MSLLIQKFGGTSLGTLERIEKASEIIIRSRQAGHDVVVVASAMAGETDKLVNLARKAGSSIPCADEFREYAMLVATGEQVSIALLSLFLNRKGCKACSMTGMQAGILTDSQYEKARIMQIDERAIRQALASGYVPVVAGFQGVDQNGDITTLGRGGSDTTAVALAAALSADECQIFTDVDGVYTADPRIEPKARLLEKINVEEMLELSSLGSKVLQVRAVEFAGKYHVPLRVLSSFTGSKGTRITDKQDENMENPIVAGITYNRQEAKLTLLGIPDRSGVASHILKGISDQGIEVDMIIQNASQNGRTDFTFTIHRDDYTRGLALLDKAASELMQLHGIENIRILGDNTIAKLSLVGVGMRNHAGIACEMFKALAAENINVQLVSTSEIKISVVIEESQIDKGVKVLHAAFKLDKLPKEEYEI